MSDDTATCSFTFVDKNGLYLDGGFLVYDDTNKYWYYNLDSAFTDIGFFNYYVYCNSSTEYGYLSQGIEVTGDGQSSHDDLTPVAVLILVPIFLSFLLIFSINALGQGHAALKIFMFLLSFISVSVSYNYGILALSTFYSTTVLTELIASDYVWYGWVIYIFIIYFVLHWLIQFTMGVNNRKGRELSFEDNGGIK